MICPEGHECQMSQICYIDQNGQMVQKGRMCLLAQMVQKVQMGEIDNWGKLE